MLRCEYMRDGRNDRIYARALYQGAIDNHFLQRQSFAAYTFLRTTWLVLRADSLSDRLLKVSVLGG
ncbi:hypothetical protein [Aquamicrobium zhengzhouense]|uniref:hypothetical protein n=1 Tax=Aquamicrobium zhengzhouense TaxID=2781738 RepID=UPI001AED5AE1|nr:hypothetical protein [Aquamicrobium zhengzhouense]